MIQQLVQRIIAANFALPATPQQAQFAALQVLESDPVDLTLHIEDIWVAVNPPPAPIPPGPPPARQSFSALGFFRPYAPGASPAWDHLGYSYVLENTRVIQILRRVVREYRSGEGLGIPSPATERWLNATEAVLFEAKNLFSPWLATSAVRPDPEAVRRNAYWRLLGLDLAFGTEDNRSPVYDKAKTANTSFGRLFEELLFEIWQAISNVRNLAGVNSSDDDRIYRIAEELRFELNSRRQSLMLSREELAAATALGWAELTLSFDTPVVIDLKAQATSPADRLRIIGDKVGLPAHSKSAEFFSMCSELSVLLRTIEAGVVSGPNFAWVLYLTPASAPAGPLPIGAESRRVITEWAAASGKDLKTRAKPIEMTSRRQLAAAR